MIQNTEDAQLDFLGWRFTWPLWLVALCLRSSGRWCGSDWALCAVTVAGGSAEMIADPFDEGADIRADLAVLGRADLAGLRRILEAPDRRPVLRAITARPASADLATLIAMADTDEVVRLGLLRAIQDRGFGHSMTA